MWSIAICMRAFAQEAIFIIGSFLSTSMPHMSFAAEPAVRGTICSPVVT